MASQQVGSGGRPACRPQLVRAEVEDRAPSRRASHRRRSGRAQRARRACSCRGRRSAHAGRRRTGGRPRSRRSPGSDTGPCPTRSRTRTRRVTCLPLADDRDRDPDRAALPEPGAEVGVHVVVDADRGDDAVGARRHRQSRHAGSTGSTAGRWGTRACGSRAAGPADAAPASVKSSAASAAASHGGEDAATSRALRLSQPPSKPPTAPRDKSDRAQPPPANRMTKPFPTLWCTSSCQTRL